ncbi:MAG: hypothetical protein M3310_03710, partial [Actinomycetota bacterium]|nr:hypothetical protein [Actinomycetota bacterium]
LAGQVYLFVHVPLLIGLTALGVGVKLGIKASVAAELPAGAAWAMGGGLALVFASIAVIDFVTVPTGVDRDVLLRLGGAALALGAAALGGALGAVGVAALLAGVVALVLLVELVTHGGDAPSDLELVGDEVDGEGLPIPMDSHAHAVADQVADH